MMNSPPSSPFLSLSIPDYALTVFPYVYVYVYVVNKNLLFALFGGKGK